ncbi:Mov34-domain-containing protein [Macrolepiota fuliginosa MF-IS2]|uniref:Mov34-domain-containing protein n=1 Tax=Macrolepiota fuliginosa MF-IS2 TaxID=1400762 RepID=A0A9P5XDA3_9AGAR|nr:Mov34-domain-containing protein [Macrolepiota fuliginosa MF-IS2]
MSHRRSRDDSNAADAGSQQQQRRPASIGELAERAMNIDWDSSREFKHCLRMAERSRNQAKGHLEQGNLENAFMYFARAAMIALDKLPTHPNYNTALNEMQRHNLGLNGQDILDQMSQIRPVLVDRFNEWRAVHPNSPLTPLDELDQQREQPERDPERVVAEEASRWRQEREERQRRDDEARVQRQPTRHPSHQVQHAPLDRRKEDPINTARQAASTPAYNPPTADYSFSRPPNHAHGSQSTIVLMPGATDAGADPAARKREREEKRRMEQEGIARRQQQADAEARQIRQVIAVNNTTPHGPQVHQNQNLSAHSSASSVATNGSSPMFPHTQVSSVTTTPASSFYHHPHQPPPPPLASVPAPPVIHQPPPAAAVSIEVPPPPATPMRAPPQPSHPPSFSADQQHRTRNEEPPAFLLSGSNVVDLNRTPTRAALRGDYAPAPVTTTSPPQDARLLFPALMSPHQQRQGYYPSHDSMFTTMGQLTLNDTPNSGPYGNPNHGNSPSGSMYNPYAATAVFGSQESHKSAAAAAAAQWGQKIMDGVGKLKRSSSHKYHSPAPGPPTGSTSASHQPTRMSPPKEGPGKVLPYIPMPPPPISALAAGGKVHPSHSHSRSHHSHSYSSQTKHHPGASPKGPELKTVALPRETLPRFLAIAKINTSMNTETCGLLLGREVCLDEESPPSYAHTSSRGRKSGKRLSNGSSGRSEYVVTTLLIPKQHGSSDMCTMDEEELVLGFTEERSLITLGWIHTHPSQSCFMSSVDLHTHSGFQAMLPESIAVVCAPKSNPNFGIFKLTDPPGLKTILECNEKEAFHPHPDVPIYTDADKGHVQMRDSPLEIIDFRL